MNISRVTYVSKTKNWFTVKESSQVVESFTDTENLDTGSRNFSFGFKTKVRGDLAEFTSWLLDGEGKWVEFSDKDQHVPVVPFKLDILK